MIVARANHANCELLQTRIVTITKRAPIFEGVFFSKSKMASEFPL